jgi:hypothetical protein
MNEEHGQAVSNFAAVAARHAFELLGDVFEIEGIDLAVPRPLCLILEPGDEIFFVWGAFTGRIIAAASSTYSPRCNA